MDSRESESDRVFAEMVRWLTAEYQRVKSGRQFGEFGCRFEHKDGQVFRWFKQKEEALKGH